jgi:PAS domain S-box-containing protein
MESKTDCSEPIDNSESGGSGTSHQSLIDLYPDVYLITDWSGRIFEANRAAEVLTGFNQNQIVGRRVEEFVAKSDVERLHILINQIQSVHLEKVDSSEVSLVREDNQLFPIQITIKSELDSTGEGKRLHWFIKDYSKNKKLDRVLWESEKRFRSVTDTASDAILIFNSNLHMLYWNEKAKEMFDYPPGETMYQLLGAFVSDGFDEKLEFEITRILNTGESELLGNTIEAVGVRNRGKTFPVELTLSTWQAEGNVFFTFIIRDISRRKQAEQQLIIAEKMASLGRLTSGIAHEISTPIAAVRAALVDITELIGEYQASVEDPDVSDKDEKEIIDDLHSALSVAERSATRVASFVRSIKNQTRSVSDQKQLFDPSAIIADALIMLRYLLRKSMNVIDFEPVEGMFEIWGSPESFAQIIINLVTNASDACSAVGGGSIAIWLQSIEGGIDMRVKDSGSGIAHEDQLKLFDPMFTTKPFGEGTGLGLTIVHHIVSGEFGGSIDVESEPGKGAEFRVFFPARSDENL